MPTPDVEAALADRLVDDHLYQQWVGQGEQLNHETRGRTWARLPVTLVPARTTRTELLSGVVGLMSNSSIPSGNW